MKMPKIGQGVGEYQWSDEHANIIRKGVDLGMTLIDTCESYNDGKSEEVVGKAIRGIRDRVTVLTKFNVKNSHYDDVIKAAEGSLKRLGTDYIDIYQMHWPSATVLFEETLAAMVELLDSGKVLSIGVGNAMYGGDLEDMYKISGGRISSYQTEYNLFDRWAETEFFPFCSEKNIQIIGYSPLDRGRMTNGAYQLGVITEIADKYGKLPSQVVLNWMVTKHNVIPIPKATNKKHLIANSESLSFQLDNDDIDVIDNECETEFLLVKPSCIKVSLEGQDSRAAYTTLQEAIDNELDFCPSPLELFGEIIRASNIKPVRVIESNDGCCYYELVEGRVRYWSWILAKGDKNIPVLVRKNF